MSDVMQVIGCKFFCNLDKDTDGYLTLEEFVDNPFEECTADTKGRHITRNWATFDTMVLEISAKNVCIFTIQ